MATIATADIQELVTAEELGARLRVRPSTVKLWTKEGIIPAIPINKKIVRYSVRRVMDALEARGRGDQ